MNSARTGPTTPFEHTQPEGFTFHFADGKTYHFSSVSQIIKQHGLQHVLCEVST